MSMDTAAAKRVGVLCRHLGVEAAGGAGAGAGAGAGVEDGCACTSNTAVALHAGSCSMEARTMEAERAKAAFHVRSMTYFLDGGEEMTRFKERALKDIINLNVMRNDDRYDLTRQETRQRTVEKLRALYKLFVSDGGNVKLRQARLEVYTMNDPTWATRNGVNFGLFLGSITSQGNAEQMAEWLPKIFMLEIYGCMAMTELGHGSNVRGLETTATYLPDTDEFDIHSPNITSTKWWIGAAGQTATHSAVYARLILNGKDLGVHSFLVQLRDMENHRPMRGVALGDIGAKMGRDGIDNGWIRFDHVRIPRTQMLMKHAQVTPSGQYIKPKKKELGYGALLLGRASIVKESSDVLKMASTIAIRYATVRRQGEPLEAGQAEPQIVDYKTLQSRLMPILATAYAFVFTGRFMMELHERLESNMNDEDLSILPDVHATSAGLKSFCSWYVLNAIETCRHACGGQGYSAYNGLSAMYANHAVMCTWEGDNYVMALQTARYLMASVAKIAAGEKTNGSVNYLREKLPSAWPVKNRKQMLSHDNQLLALKALASNLVRRASEALNKAKKTQSDKVAWNNCSVELFNASRAHCMVNIATHFIAAVKHREAAEARDANLKAQNLAAPLATVCSLFGLSLIQAELAQLMTYAFVSPEQSHMMQDEINSLCEQVRAQAIPLADAFNIDDFVLNSPIGRYDGDVYGPLFEQVKKAPHALTRAPYYESTIKPMLNGADLGGSVGDDSDDDFE